jgi:hypothetical protein
VEEFTRAERVASVPVERVIVALKEAIREVAHHSPGSRAYEDSVERVVRWCVAAYYDAPIPGPKGTPSGGTPTSGPP